MFNLAVLTIQQAFNNACNIKRDMSKEGRINAFLTSAIDEIISGLEGISCEYNNTIKMDHNYVKAKLLRIKAGVDDLEKLVEVLKDEQGCK